MAIDAATILAPRLNRYFSIVALLTLGEAQPVAAAVRKLNPAVVAVSQSFGSSSGVIGKREAGQRIVTRLPATKGGMSIDTGDGTGVVTCMLRQARTAR